MKYWLDELDRMGLVVVGIFLGGTIEAIGIPKLSIVMSVALLIVIGVIRLLIKKKVTKDP